MSAHAIVVDIDQPQRPEQPALDAALANAGDDVPIWLFHSVFHRNLTEKAGEEEQVLDEARELLLETRRTGLAALAADRCGQNGHSEVAWTERGWPALLRLAQSVSAGLVVANSRRQHRWQRIGYDNEDWELIRHCPPPLLLTRQSTPKRYRRVVAALDPLHADDKPADLDRRILQHASEFADRHGATLTALNVANAPAAAATAGMATVVPNQDVYDELVEAHRRRIDELIAETGCRAAQCQVIPGVPSIEIVDFVQHSDADLLVMGAVSRSTLGRLLIGNTAERVLDRVDCDVLVIKPGDFDSRLPTTIHLTGAASAL